MLLFSANLSNASILLPYITTPATAISANVAPSDLIAQFGTGFKEDQTSVADYGKFNPEAVKLMDRVGWQ